MLNRSLSIRLDARRAVRTDEGFLRVPATITRTGIFEYRRGGKTVREFRGPDEVLRADSLQTLSGVPLTIHHAVPFVTARDVQAHVVGHVGHDVVARDARFVDATLHVWRADAVEAIESGQLAEVSAGYRAAAAPGGAWKGQAYDAAQTDIRYNHVALLPKGVARGGDQMAIRLDGHDLIEFLRLRLDGRDPAEVAEALGLDGPESLRMLLDGDLGVPDVPTLTRAADMIRCDVSDLISMAGHAPPQTKEPTAMKREIVINGVTFEVEIAEGLGATFDGAVAADAQVRTDAADAKARLDRVTAERDVLRTRCDAAEAQIAAQARAGVLEQAQVLHADLDVAEDASVRDIQVAALTGAGHEVRTDASDDYVAGMFAYALAAPKKTPGAGAAPPSERNDANDADTDVAAAARRRMIERHRAAWKA